MDHTQATHGRTDWATHSAFGWIRLSTHRGVVMAGSRSVRYRIISKEAEPDPRITAARRTVVGTPEASRISPTSLRDSRCGDRSSPSGKRPPRWTTRLTPASRAACPKVSAVRRSRASNRRPVPREWMRY